MLIDMIINTAWSEGRITKWDKEIISENFPDDEVREGLDLVSLHQLGLNPNDWWDQIAFVAALGQLWTNPSNVEARPKNWDFVPVEFGGCLQPVRGEHRTLRLVATETAPWSNRYRFLVAPK